MKVLYIITLPDLGGAQTHLYEILKHARCYGIEPILALGQRGWLSEEAEKISVETHLIKSLTREISLIRDGRTLWQMVRLIQKVKPDLVHCHSSKAGILGRFASALARRPCIFTAHGWAFTEGVAKKKRILYAAIEKIAGYVSKKILCVSEYDAQLVCKIMPEHAKKMCTIHNCIEDEPVYQVDWKNKRKTERLNCVVVARFSPQKRNKEILQALRKVLDSGNQVHVTFIGGGEELSDVKAVCQALGLKKNVTFYGICKDVYRRLPDFDVFLLYSNWEGFPISILEAMRAGLPVIASDVGGVKEAVDEKTGWLIPRGDENKLVEILSKIACSRGDLEFKGIAGRRKYEEMFTVDRMMERIAGVYTEVLGIRER